MRHRYLTTALALVLILALAAPVFASPGGDVPSDAVAKGSFANKTSKKAKRLAREAKNISRKANLKVNKQRGRVNALGRRVGAVETLVRTLEGAFSQVEELLDALGQRVDTLEAESASTSDRAAGTVSTTEDADYVALAGGPEVTVTVPGSGMIEVWAQATIVNEGAVSLYEDGQQVPGQAPNDICDGPPGALISHSVGDTLTLSTPTGTPFLFCGSEGAPAPVLFETTPGEHTYELRYADCGCTPDGATFEDRSLIVAPRP